MCKKFIFSLVVVLILSTFMTNTVFAETANIKSVKGSSLNEPENPPENAIDGDPDTRWGAPRVNDTADGAWLEFELNKEELIESISIVFYKYSERIHTIGFDKYVDGKWVNVSLSKTKSDPDNEEDVFMLKTPDKSKSWRVRFLERVDAVTGEEADIFAVCEVSFNIKKDEGNATPTATSSPTPTTAAPTTEAETTAVSTTAAAITAAVTTAVSATAPVNGSNESLPIEVIIGIIGGVVVVGGIAAFFIIKKKKG